MNIVFILSARAEDFDFRKGLSRTRIFKEGTNIPFFHLVVPKILTLEKGSLSENL